jgi:hypothetical protein
MSVLDVLDATRVCARSLPTNPPAPAPTVARREPRPASPAAYSWWSLARNPLAALVTGAVGTMATVDALRRSFSLPPAHKFETVG